MPLFFKTSQYLTMLPPDFRQARRASQMGMSSGVVLLCNFQCHYSQKWPERSEMWFLCIMFKISSLTRQPLPEPLPMRPSICLKMSELWNIPFIYSSVIGMFNEFLYYRASSSVRQTYACQRSLGLVLYLFYQVSCLKKLYLSQTNKTIAKSGLVKSVLSLRMSLHLKYLCIKVHDS